MDLKSYWDERIQSTDRYSSIGRIGYPEQINRHAKNAAKRPIQQACIEHNIDLEGAKVLDAGCGTGIYSEFYSNQGAEVTGFDFSASAIREVRERGLVGSYTVQELPDIGYKDGQFDLTHCFSVLYHILDDGDWEESIRQLARVTDGGGNLLLRIEWTDDPGPPSEHYKQRSQSAYKRIFDELGLTIVDIYPIEDEPLYPRIARYAPSITTKLGLFTQNQSNRILLLEFD